MVPARAVLQDPCPWGVEKPLTAAHISLKCPSLNASPSVGSPPTRLWRRMGPKKFAGDLVGPFTEALETDTQGLQGLKGSSLLGSTF